MPMNPERKALWLEALRSGEYTQGRNSLKREVGPDAARHCCLGVACEVYKRETGEGEWVRHGEDLEFTVRDDTGVDFSWSQLPAPVAEWFDLDVNPYVFEDRGQRERDSLAGLNDAGRSFREIADIIEQEL